MHHIRLLLINSRFLPLIGGGETYILELISTFIGRGWEVHLATNHNGYDKEEWNGCKIHYVDGFNDDRLRLWECMPDLRRILDRVKPDLVHVHNIMPFFTYANVIDKQEFPTVLTIHNTPNLPHRIFGTLRNYEAERAFVRQLLANGRYDKLTVGSQYYLDSYLKVTPWIRDRAEVIYFFPAQLNQGPFTPHSIQNKKYFKLLFPSRIAERKGIIDVIEVLSRLPSTFTLLVPSFAADEQKDPTCRRHVNLLIDSLGIRDRIEIPDKPVPPEEMASYYKAADIVLIPSHYEGFGIAAVEAMSWGVPVIASDVGGLREIFTDTFDGLLIPPNNTQALRRAILQLAENTTLYKNIANNETKTVQERFSRNMHMKRITQVYEEVLRKYNKL